MIWRCFIPQSPRPGQACAAERRDVLLVQVESLDIGAIERAMPRLAARIPTGVYYPRCLAYHGPGGSADCDVAVVEGCEPLWDAVSFGQPGYSWPNSWVRRLREASRSTALAHGLPGAYFNFAQVMSRLGYELWDLDRLGLVEHRGEFGARDGELVDAVLARLPSLPSPCVLHVVTMTSHAPFTQQRAWWSGPISGDDYRDAMACVDAQLDRLLAGFLDRAPRGLVVLFGDHAAGLPGSAIERSGGVQREYVPLLIIGADVPSRTDERLASFLDIGRTLLPAACVRRRPISRLRIAPAVSRSARLHCRRLEEIRDYRFPTLIVNALVAVRLPASVTCTVKLGEPGFVGRPADHSTRLVQ